MSVYVTAQGRRAAPPAANLGARGSALLRNSPPSGRRIASLPAASWSAARVPTNGGCQTTRRIMTAVQIRVGQLLSTLPAPRRRRGAAAAALRRSAVNTAGSSANARLRLGPSTLRGSLIAILGLAPSSHLLASPLVCSRVFPLAPCIAHSQKQCQRKPRRRLLLR